jgi:hypothetical protein
MTVLQWSRASDRVGRKPVLLLGIFGLSLSMLCFGLSRTFTTLVLRCAFRYWCRTWHLMCRPIISPQSLHNWCPEWECWCYEKHARGVDGLDESSAGVRVVSSGLVVGNDTWVGTTISDDIDFETHDW